MDANCNYFFPQDGGSSAQLWHLLVHATGLLDCCSIMMLFLHMSRPPRSYLYSLMFPFSCENRPIIPLSKDMFFSLSEVEGERDLFQVITMSKCVLKIIVHLSWLDWRTSMVITDLLPGPPFSCGYSWNFGTFLKSILGHIKSDFSISKTAKKYILQADVFVC